MPPAPTRASETLLMLCIHSAPRETAPGLRMEAWGFLWPPGFSRQEQDPWEMDSHGATQCPLPGHLGPSLTSLRTQFHSPSPRPSSAVGRTPPSTCQWGPAVQGLHSQKGPWKSTPDALIFSPEDQSLVHRPLVAAWESEPSPGPQSRPV